MKSRSQEIIPGTWSTGRQFIRSAPTPISSNRRAARPKRSPSGGPQCCPNTPQTPWRQRRKESQTGSPVSRSRSTVSKISGSRTSVSVSSRMRSGGSSENTLPSSSSVPRRSEELTSSEIANATAQSSTRSPSSIARRASFIPSRATSIQCAVAPPPGPWRSSRSGADRIDQVSVESTLQPAST